MSSGINMTIIPINYTPRVGLLMIAFSFIVIVGFCLNFSLNKYKKERNSSRISEKETTVIN